MVGFHDSLPLELAGFIASAFGPIHHLDVIPPNRKLENRKDERSVWCYPAECRQKKSIVAGQRLLLGAVFLYNGALWTSGWSHPIRREAIRRRRSSNFRAGCR